MKISGEIQRKTINAYMAQNLGGKEADPVWIYLLIVIELEQ